MKVLPAGVLQVSEDLLQMSLLAPDLQVLLMSPADLKQSLEAVPSQEMERHWILDWLLLLLLCPQDAEELYGECAPITQLLQELGEVKRWRHTAFLCAFPDENTSQRSFSLGPHPWTSLLGAVPEMGGLQPVFTQRPSTGLWVSLLFFWH